jgi:hypothetical protein
MKRFIVFIAVLTMAFSVFGAATLNSGLPTDLEILVTAQNLYDYDVLTQDNFIALDIIPEVVPLNNFEATATPEASMDVTEGYEVGSFWFDTTNDVMYSCIDATTDTAIWYIVGVQALEPINNYAATEAPAGTDDVSEGYSVGSMWVDVTNNNVYFCLDSTEGSAVWTVALGNS